MISYIRSAAEAHATKNAGSNTGSITSAANDSCLAGWDGLTQLVSAYGDDEFQTITLPFNFKFQGEACRCLPKMPHAARV